MHYCCDPGIHFNEVLQITLRPGLPQQTYCREQRLHWILLIPEVV